MSRARAEVAATGNAPAAAYRPWRDPAFRVLWAGATVSMAGGYIAYVVLPVLLFQVTGSAGKTALLLTVQGGPYFLFGLLAGGVADRVNRRALMVGCDLTSAAAVATLPLASTAGTLTVPHIHIVGLITATCLVFRDAACCSWWRPPRAGC